MPKTTREWAKRKLTQAWNNVDTAMAYLLEVQGPYKEPPETDDTRMFCANCEEIMTALLHIQGIIAGLRDSV